MVNWRVNWELWVILELVVLHIVYGNVLVQVGLVSTRVRTDRVRIEFFQLVCVADRINVGIFFATLNSNPDTNTTRQHDLPLLLTMNNVSWIVRQGTTYYCYHYLLRFF